MKEVSGYQIPDIERAARCIQAIELDGLIKYDMGQQVVLLKDEIMEFQIENRNQATAAIKQLQELPMTALISDLKFALIKLGRDFIEPVIVRITEIETELAGGIPAVPPAGDEPEPPKEPAPKKGSKKYTFDETDMRVAKFLASNMNDANPGVKLPDTFDSWANTIRLMREQDKRDPQLIAGVIKWIFTKSDFWFDKILSAANLREHFDRMAADMKRGKGGVPNGTGGKDSQGAGRFNGATRNAGE
jgi:hypothetical protein